MGTVGRFAMVEADPGGVDALLAGAGSAAAQLAADARVLAAKAWFGFPFDEHPDNPPDLRLAAVSAMAEDRDALTEAWVRATGDLAGIARFDVEGEAVRATGSGWGFEVPTSAAPPLEPDEPVFVMITGDVLAEHLDAFTAAAKPVVAQAKANPGYLGGCGLVSTMLDITSFSCWASSRDARRFGFGRGQHREAMAADEAGGWHDRSSALYLTFRVLSASGTLLGDAPFVASKGEPAPA